MSQKNSTIRSQNYGSSTTIGPRQVSMIADIYDMVSNGERATLDTLRFFHGSQAVDGNSFKALRARKLVKGRANDLHLTMAGHAIARNVQHTVIPAGLGLVAVGTPVKR